MLTYSLFVSTRRISLYKKDLVLKTRTKIFAPRTPGFTDTDLSASRDLCASPVRKFAEFGLKPTPSQNLDKGLFQKGGIMFVPVDRRKQKDAALQIAIVQTGSTKNILTSETTIDLFNQAAGLIGEVSVASVLTFDRARLDDCLVQFQAFQGYCKNWGLTLSRAKSLGILFYPEIR